MKDFRGITFIHCHSSVRVNCLVDCPEIVNLSRKFVQNRVIYFISFSIARSKDTMLMEVLHVVQAAHIRICVINEHG